MIPGIPLQTRISILQQTSSDGSDKTTEAKPPTTSSSNLSVLEYVIDKATSRSEIQHEIDGEISPETHHVMHGADI